MYEGEGGGGGGGVKVILFDRLLTCLFNHYYY